MATAVATRPVLAPIRETRMLPRRTRRGQTPHLECFAAETTDGIWDFEREDSPGTPWLVFHRPSVADKTWPAPVAIRSSLEDCQLYVGSGRAQDALAAYKHPKGVASE